MFVNGSLGERIARLRKQRGWTQAELGEKVGVHGHHITRLERDKMRPSSATLTKLAEVFEVSVDDLIANGEAPPAAIHDAQLLRTFQQAQELDTEDRMMVMRMVQALVTKKRMEQAMRLEA